MQSEPTNDNETVDSIKGAIILRDRLDPGALVSAAPPEADEGDLPLFAWVAATRVKDAEQPPT
jgi:hypothetical protein